MENIIYYGIMLVVAVVAFVVGKYVLPKIPADALTTLVPWAEKLVVWAREFLASESGQEKMTQVTKQLADIAKKNKIDVTEDQLKAIAQDAYEIMKAQTQNTEKAE